MMRAWSPIRASPTITSPPCGVYWIAFATRFNKTCFKRSRSPTNWIWSIAAILRCTLLPARTRISWKTSNRSVSSSTGFLFSVSLPESAWVSNSNPPTSRVRRPASWSMLESDSSSNCFMRRIKSALPLITVSGVRSSWLTSARKRCCEVKRFSRRSRVWLKASIRLPISSLDATS